MGLRQPLPHAGRQWFTTALSFTPLLALTNEAGIDLGLVRQVVRKRPTTALTTAARRLFSNCVPTSKVVWSNSCR